MRLRAATLFSIVLLASCAGPAPGGSAGIVTLVPSFADDVYALGAGRGLVAVSAYTDDPRAAKLPRVADASSVDVEKIVALRPSAVAGIPAQTRLVEPLRRAGLHVVLLDDDGYDLIFSDLLAIGVLTNRQAQAAGVVARLQRRTAQLRAAARRFRRHPRVFVVLESAPVWTAGRGSYISTLVALAGGINAAGDLRAAYGQYSAETLLENQPDVIVADRAARLDAVLDREPWRSLRAVKLHRVFYVDSDLLERPGPRYNEAIAWLEARLRPVAMANS